MNKLNKAAVVSGENDRATESAKPGKKKKNPLGGSNRGKKRSVKADRQPKEKKSRAREKPAIKATEEVKAARPGVNGDVIKIVVPLIAVVVAAAVAFSSLDALDDVSTAMLAADNSTRNKENSLSRLETAEQFFVGQRTFEIAYSDLDSILELLEGVSGITVANVTAIDPHNGFAEVGTKDDVGMYGAARVTLAVSDVNSALKSLSKAQLAINTISMSGNNITLDVLLGVGEWQ